MAEGWARHLISETVEAYSAGTEPWPIDPRAIRVMAEAGVDISNHYSKHLRELPVDFDYVITVCADENCPIFPGITRIVHVAFDDPPKLAESAKTEEEALGHYRRVRNEIKEFIEKLPDMISRVDPE